MTIASKKKGAAGSPASRVANKVAGAKKNAQQQDDDTAVVKVRVDSIISGDADNPLSQESLDIANELFVDEDGNPDEEFISTLREKSNGSLYQLVKCIALQDDGTTPMVNPADNSNVTMLGQRTVARIKDENGEDLDDIATPNPVEVGQVLNAYGRIVDGENGKAVFWDLGGEGTTSTEDIVSMFFTK